MKVHFERCLVDHFLISEEDITAVLKQSNKLSKILSFEALYISQIKPAVNTMDECCCGTQSCKYSKVLLLLLSIGTSANTQSTQYSTLLRIFKVARSSIALLAIFCAS